MGWIGRLCRVVSAPAGVLASDRGCDAACSSSDGEHGDEWQELLLKHFQLLEVLGAGGYSTVYRARRRSDGREVALKVTDMGRLTPWSRRAAVREAHVLAALPHPCLTSYREAFALGSRLCVATEAARGGDLRRLLEQHIEAGTHMSEERVWRIFLQVALAVEHLHASRILHRDIKPANVLLASGGLVQLTDLGICGKLSCIFTSKEAGTPQYKAPEMWRGEPYSFSSDMWALGCLLFELCTGRPLFCAQPCCATASSALASVRQQILEFDQPPQLPECYSADLAAVLGALLHTRPAQRLSAAELLAMPAVTAHMAALPQLVHAQLAAMAQQPRRPPACGVRGSGCPVCSSLQQEALSAAELNACLPHAAYPDGSPGLRDSLAAGQPKRGRSLWRRSRAADCRSTSVSSRASSASAYSDCSTRSAGTLSLASLDLAGCTPLASPCSSGGGSPRSVAGSHGDSSLPPQPPSRLQRSSCVPALAAGC